MRNIDPIVIDKIRAREAEALALGWKNEELWETRFWNITPEGNRPGLASGLRSNQEIGEITSQYIEIFRMDKFKGKLVQKFIKK